MRGTVLQYDDNSGSGFVSGDDGIRYTFRRADLQQLRPISAGTKVDFVPKDGTASEIYIIDANGAIASGNPAPQGGGYAPGFQAGYATAAPAGASAYSGEDLSMWGYFKKVMAMSFNGEGRARRKEFWSYALFLWLFWMVVYLVLTMTAFGALSNFYASYNGYGYGANPVAAFGALGIWAVLISILGLAFLPATVTVIIRRLHDIGMSGWMILIGIVPVIGGLFLFVCYLIPSQTQVNKYGLIPKPAPPAYGG